MDEKLSKAVNIVDVKNLIWFGSIIVAIMLSWNSLNTQLALTQRDVKAVIDQHNELSKTLGADQKDFDKRLSSLEIQVFGQKIADNSATLK